MSTSLQTPIRVLVKGASTVLYISEMGGPRSDFNFGRVIEAELVEAGQPAEVRVTGAPSDLVKLALRHWERQVLGWSPDVVVLHYGHYECIHYFLPRWLERHANSHRGRRGRVRAFYRRRLLRPTWVSLAKLQSRADRRFNSLLFSRRLRRVAADVAELVGHLQTVGSPLIVVMGVVPPGRRWQSWMPGLAQRTALMNELLADMVRRIDRPDVRLMPTAEILAPHFAGDEEPTPDGGHYSARAHRIIGEWLTREIAEWANTQPHLQPRAAGEVRPIKRSERAS